MRGCILISLIFTFHRMLMNIFVKENVFVFFMSTYIYIYIYIHAL